MIDSWISVLIESGVSVFRGTRLSLPPSLPPSFPTFLSCLILPHSPCCLFALVLKFRLVITRRGEEKRLLPGARGHWLLVAIAARPSISRLLASSFARRRWPGSDVGSVGGWERAPIGGCNVLVLQLRNRNQNEQFFSFFDEQSMLWEILIVDFNNAILD